MVYETYCAVELVAIPPNFDIKSHLTMREQAGIFEYTNVSIKHLEGISMGVQNTPVFTLLNNPNVALQSMIYFLYILDQLGFIIRGIGSGFHMAMHGNYEQLLRSYERARGTVYIQNHRADTINFAIINMIQILNNETIEKAIKIAACEYNEQKLATEKIESLLQTTGG
jgi:hypothetical protein